jgi:hypothetical protein
MRIRGGCACVLLAAGAAAAQVNFCYSQYSGSWHNHTFSTTGPVTATLIPGSVTVWITFDADGNVFGGNNPPAVTISGPDFQPGWTGTLTNDPWYGTVNAHITPAGAITVQGTSVPSPFVSSYSATGTLTACHLHLDGVINLFPTGTATTTIDADIVCYANCDNSTAPPVLNVLDFNCFLNRFSAGDSYANCDGSTAAPVLNVLDFNCFLNRFSAGCP